MAGLIRLSLEQIISLVIVLIAIIIIGFLVIKYMGFGFMDISTYR